MTSKIVVLPADVANRIAAGEVVERPASAVKELVENAIDAGARRITVEIGEAGRRLIRVTDDGEGMSPADAARSFLRHATSKIRTDGDLSSIQTLGFRGEALPSIAAVSRMRLVTVPAGAACGTEIRVEGGSIKEERDAAAAPGTTVEVADLFYNTPVRKKFLKSPATEFGHVCQVIQRQALGFPGIQFRLLHNGALVSEYSPVRSLRERIQQVYGLSLVDASVEVTEGDEDSRLDGLCSRPLKSGLSRAPQEILVNHRWVKCPSLAHAVYEAYGTYLAKGHHPQFILHLAIDPRVVDTNVHPMKREVRFSQQERLHDLVRRWVRAAISEQTADALVPKSSTAQGIASARPISGEREEDMTFGTFSVGSERFSREQGPRERAFGSDRVAEVEPAYLPAIGTEVHPLGQIADRYLLAQVGAELQIVDQHTAHERVLFERLRAQLEQGVVLSQQLLLPQTVELPASVAVVLRAHLEELTRLGFEVEDFGGDAFLVRATPALLTQSGREEPSSLLRALVEEWEEEASTGSLHDPGHAALASIACHSAVRSGRRLDLSEIRHLLEDWQGAGLPSTCPHGRRVAMRLTIEELDRIFGRQGWL
jgi:DNA mismatch repair protein MutL